MLCMSFPKDFIFIIRPFILNKHIEKKKLTINIPLIFYDYVKILEEGTVSSALVQITLQFIEQLIESDLRKVFISASELIRNAIVYDMMLPIQQRVVTHFMLNEFSKKICIMKYQEREYDHLYTKICIGNKFHPNGTWRDYHTKKELRHTYQFEKIIKKTKKYFTTKYLLKNRELFEQANNLNLLDNLNESKNLLVLSNFLKDKEY